MNPTSIALTIHDGQPLADSRVLARGFGIQHENLLRTIREHASTLGVLETRLGESGPNAGKISHYLLTEEQALLLATICRLTPETLAFRVSLTRAFLAMRDQLSGRTEQLPKDYPSALRALADEVDARQALASQAEADAPKVAYAEAVQVAGQTWPMRKIVKLLKPKPKEDEFKAWLKAKGWLTSSGEASSERLTSGDMVLVETEREHRGVPYRDANGKGRMDVTSHWTGPGKVRVIAAWTRSRRAAEEGGQS